METDRIKIDGIPTVIWGKPAKRIIIAAHGSHSSKTDDCIRLLAECATGKDYQVVSFDWPQHGERACEKEPIMPDECVRELQVMYSYAAARAEAVSLFGCSMGAYFQLLAFANAAIDRVWFLSPVTDMQRVIDNLMAYCRVTPAQLKEKVFIDNDIEPLYFPYYEYVREHPVTHWGHKTCILRGENDTLAEFERVRRFADDFGCELTQQKDGEHWFHTEEQLQFFRDWLESRL